MSLWVNKTLKFLHRAFELGPQVEQVRHLHKFVDWRMLRDVKRRSYVKKYGKERLRINALRKNTILPPELKAIADEEIAAVPNWSSIVWPVRRCVVTSRSKGVVLKYRLSRIVFRHLADYNQLSGVQRAMW